MSSDVIRNTFEIRKMSFSDTVVKLSDMYDFYEEMYMYICRSNDIGNENISTSRFVE